MADNVTLPGAGASVRTIDRSGVETQVVALDKGGPGAESLVADGNPLPVETSFDAQAAGDFAGMNLMEQLITGDLQLAMVDKGAARDPDGGSFMADCKELGPWMISAAGNTTGVIDTKGYNSCVFLVVGGAATLAVAGRTGTPGIGAWKSVECYTDGNSAANINASNSVIAGGSAVFIAPCHFRYLRMTCTAFTSGPVQVYAVLRNAHAPMPRTRVEMLGYGLVTGGVVGGIAAGSAPANPLTAGGLVRTAAATALSNNQFHTLTSGAQLLVKPYGLPEADWSYTGSISTTTSTALKTAGAAGVKNYCTAIQVQNTGASATTLTLLNGSTAVWTCSLPATMATPLDIIFPTPLQTAAATAINVQLGTAVAVTVNAQGYQSA